MTIAEVIIEVRKQRVKSKNIFLNEDMYNRLTLNGDKVKMSLQSQFDCNIFKTVDIGSIKTGTTFNSNKFITELSKALEARKLNKQTKPTYEDILNSL